MGSILHKNYIYGKNVWMKIRIECQIKTVLWNQAIKCAVFICISIHVHVKLVFNMFRSKDNVAQMSDVAHGRLVLCLFGVWSTLQQKNSLLRHQIFMWHVPINKTYMVQLQNDKNKNTFFSVVTGQNCSSVEGRKLHEAEITLYTVFWR